MSTVRIVWYGVNRLAFLCGNHCRTNLDSKMILGLAVMSRDTPTAPADRPTDRRAERILASMGFIWLLLVAVVEIQQFVIQCIYNIAETMMKDEEDGTQKKYAAERRRKINTMGSNIDISCK
jgi:hypothetical protein